MDTTKHIITLNSQLSILKCILLCRTGIDTGTSEVAVYGCGFFMPFSFTLMLMGCCFCAGSATCITVEPLGMRRIITAHGRSAVSVMFLSLY